MSNFTKKKIISPLKRSSTSSTRDLSSMVVDKDSARGISSKEVEIEHLKTSLNAVSTRLAVLKDMERDVQNSQVLTHDSELKRAQLQDHIQYTAQLIKDDAAKNKRYQDDLITENKALQDEILRL